MADFSRRRFNSLNLRGRLKGGVTRRAPASVEVGGKMVSGKEAKRAVPRSTGAETPGRLQAYRTEIFTYFTVPGDTHELFAFQGWARMTVQLETAGPVTIGQKPTLTPVLSGKGMLIDTDEPQSFVVAKGTRIYIAANTVDRVKVVVEPIPWLDEIAMRIDGVTAVIKAAAEAFMKLLTRREVSDQELPCPPEPRPPVPRLRRGPKRRR